MCDNQRIINLFELFGIKSIYVKIDRPETENDFENILTGSKDKFPLQGYVTEVRKSTFCGCWSGRFRGPQEREYYISLEESCAYKSRNVHHTFINMYIYD